MTRLIYNVSAGAEVWPPPLLLSSEVIFYMQTGSPSRSDDATLSRYHLQKNRLFKKKKNADFKIKGMHENVLFISWKLKGKPLDGLNAVRRHPRKP